MRNIIHQLLALGPELAAYILTVPLLGAHVAQAAFTQTAVSSPNLDLSQLGRVAVGGDFDSISLYTYQGQNENTSTNGSQSLLTRYPDGAFQSLALADADASIQAMCAFVARDGKLNGVVVGGNFTSLGGVPSNAVALWNPADDSITALDGLTGQVQALYCDQKSATVYVGGNFMAGNSTNAMAWTTGWVNLPFAGFNGEVNSITKNAAGNIVFAGQFDGLGNATGPSTPDQQVISLSSGTISAEGSSTLAGFADPKNIVCKTGESDGSGNTWLLADNRQGFWDATYGFGFNPTKLRLYNTAYQGRGTKTFHFEEMNSGGILNLTYVDPTTGRNESCIQQCPLPQGNTTAQDFHFVAHVGMSHFRIWITDWYGAGGGLSGIEMFQDDIYSFAVDSFNEPKCDGVSAGATSSSSPANTWAEVEGHGYTASNFLSATLKSTSQVGPDTNVVFRPNIQQSGNYSVIFYTPGCIQDGTCATRGIANVTASMTSRDTPITTTVYQTNNYDKFDQIYYGYIDAENFQPTVTLSPMAGQSVPLTVVASRVRFDLVGGSSGGLNGLYEYNPNQLNTDNTDFSSSKINTAGTSLNSNADVSTVIEHNDVLYVAGRFSRGGISNVMSIGSGNATALPKGGLNGDVLAMRLNGSTLYLGGTFNNTAEGSTDGLENVASFNIDKNEWGALGAGVNGAVSDIVPLQFNITAGNEQSCLGISGNFTSVNAANGHAAFDVDGFALWVIGKNSWLHNIANASVAFSGTLTAYAEVPGMEPVYGGMIRSQGLAYSDAVELVGSGAPQLESLNIAMQQSTNSSSKSAKHKRALTANPNSGANYTGVYDGFFYSKNNLNITILGGKFAATASNGSTVENLVFINTTSNNQQTVTGVSGLDSDSVFAAMDVYETKLWAGGAINGTVNGNPARGLVVYDLSGNRYAAPHPPALGGDTVIVNAISAQPEGTNVYVGGRFETAGSLPCRTLCYYNTQALQWQNPGTGLSGVINAMMWTSNQNLLIAGNLTINGNHTMMATYDTKKETFTEFAGASTLPGPISAISAVNGDYDEFWVSGTATNNQSVFLYKYQSNTWTAASGLGAATTIRKLQIMPLTSKHADSHLMSNDQSLMILGNINIPDQGNASAVLFNGTSYEPYILTNTEDGSQGSLSAIFVSNPQAFMDKDHHHLGVGAIVAIGLAIALGLIGIIVLIGILLERRRRRIEGYVPISGDRSANVNRLPPEQLFSKLEGKPSPPRI
ncbi:uncharacterized protein MYCFIDRAFT_167006 [Pseudocercospora fijiensis CIRAD86]|uniref:Cellular morphogenesis protein n=1 Tax=Pseudocercospora fijiensis (strain CIRAD86) TaxID=383855 RepID=M2YN02_PSEFD|nr:uncharacterized protein MYCFIDRAFT_167006 [Pseudocercospora fijiensis CIRAD86]EME79110.1 hypothetical protein MYCFIDRAFT_167006 [Pseudocercospora fijiensis CIRAD86]